MMPMRTFKRVLGPISLLSASHHVPRTNAYGQSLADCKTVAAKFRNTCAHGDYDTPATSMASMASETESCSNGARCIEAGTLNGGTCSWERKLCVTCRDDNGVTKIRVQTNNLPDHCIQSTLAKAKNFDYEVIFNRAETFGDWVNTFNSQSELDDAVCPIYKGYNTALSQIVEFGEDESKNAMAFAINGVAFQFANQLGEDPVSPITETNEQPLDICLGHNQRNSISGMYHYHGVSPCINLDFLNSKTMSDCTANTQCSDDVAGWAVSGFPTTKTVIGLSKFGHVLYGPYDEDGDLWDIEDVDACNGAWSTNQDEYFYVGTRWHPYAVGCQGPANFPQNEDSIPLFAGCSNNGMDQYALALQEDETSTEPPSEETTKGVTAPPSSKGVDATSAVTAVRILNATLMVVLCIVVMLI